MTRATTSLCALLLLTCGCDSQESSDSSLQSEIAKTKAERKALEAERLKMQRVSDSMHATKRKSEAQVKVLTSQLDKLKRENEKLKQTVAQSLESGMNLKAEVGALRAQLARAGHPRLPTASVPKPVRTDGSRAGPSTQAPDTTEKQQQIQRITLAKEELEERIAEFRSRIAKAQAKVSSLVRATVDVPMNPPANAMVIPAGGRYGGYSGGPDGLILRRERVITGSHKEGRGVVQNYYYRYIPFGPAIKRGDFRTAREKDVAIAQAKKELTPLHEERGRLEEGVKQLDKELAELKK